MATCLQKMTKESNHTTCAKEIEHLCSSCGAGAGLSSLANLRSFWRACALMSLGGQSTGRSSRAHIPDHEVSPTAALKTEVRTESPRTRHFPNVCCELKGLSACASARHKFRKSRGPEPVSQAIRKPWFFFSGGDGEPTRGLPEAPECGLWGL